MEIDFSFVREKVMAKQLSAVHIPGKYQWANILTKPIFTAKFLLMCSKLNTHIVWGGGGGGGVTAST